MFAKTQLQHSMNWTSTSSVCTAHRVQVTKAFKQFTSIFCCCCCLVCYFLQDNFTGHTIFCCSNFGFCLCRGSLNGWGEQKHRYNEFIHEIFLKYVIKCIDWEIYINAMKWFWAIVFVSLWPPPLISPSLLACLEWLGFAISPVQQKPLSTT